MPRKPLMSPDFGARHARWRKTYKGKCYTVTCAELGLPEAEWTPLDSYQAANRWWEARRTELDANPLVTERDRIVRRLKAIQDEEAELQIGIAAGLAELAPAVFKPPQRKPVAVTVGQALDDWYAVLKVNAEPTSLVRLSLFVRDCKVPGGRKST